MHYHSAPTSGRNIWTIQQLWHIWSYQTMSCCVCQFSHINWINSWKNYRSCNILYLTGSGSTCPLFLRALSFEGTTKWACNYLNQNFKFLFLNSLANNLLFELCNELFFWISLQLWHKRCDCFVSLVSGCFPKKINFTGHKDRKSVVPSEM